MVGALALLKFVPDLLGLFNSDKTVVEKVSSLAMSITGKPTVSEAEIALSQDPNLAFEFKMAAMADETVLEKLDEESRARASAQYATSHKQADAIAGNIMKKNLPIICLLVLVNAGVVYGFTYFAAEQIGQLAVVSNLIGVVIGSLLQERQQVVSFFFGSSLGSKLKSAQSQE